MLRGGASGEWWCGCECYGCLRCTGFLAGLGDFFWTLGCGDLKGERMSSISQHWNRDKVAPLNGGEASQAIG